MNRRFKEKKFIVALLVTHTKIVGVLASPHGKILCNSPKPFKDFSDSLPYQMGSMLSYLEQDFLERTGLPNWQFSASIGAIVVSHTGAPSVGLCQRLRERLDSIGWTSNCHLQIQSEAETALAGLGERDDINAPGIAISSGTICTVAVRGTNFKLICSGGHIPGIDDDGGAYHIGRLVLKYAIDVVENKRTFPDCLREYLISDSRGPTIEDLVQWARFLPSERKFQFVAELAMTVDQACKNGDKYAKGILEEVGKRIVKKVDECVNLIGINNLPKPIPLALVGGVLRGSAHMRNYIVSNLESKLGSVTNNTFKDHVILGAVKLGSALLRNDSSASIKLLSFPHGK